MAGVCLYSSERPEDWRQAIALYHEALELKAKSTKNKPGAAKDLLDLDQWYQNDLPEIIQERNEKYVTLEELQKLLQWKLSKGKYRPTLPKLIASNQDKDVVDTSKRAFKKLPKLKEAIQELSKLKGVGPATASAVLAAGSPQEVAFMADEAIQAIPGMVIKYDIKCYMQYAQSVNVKLEWLKEHDTEKEWTAHKVELALWTDTVRKQYPSLQNIPSESSGSKRKGSKEDTVSSAKKTKAACSEIGNITSAKKSEKIKSKKTKK